MPFRTRLLAANSDIVRTVITMAVTSALLIPTAINQSAEHAKEVKATTVLSESTGLHHEQLAIYPVIASERLDRTAAATLDQANVVAGQVAAKTDVAPLTQAIAALSSYRSQDDKTVIRLTDTTKSAIAAATAAAAEYDRAAAAQAAAAAAQAAAALAAANSPDGARATARSMAASSYGWGAGQFQCLDHLWSKESGWSYTAHNPSGATGIPQALPGDKMASVGADWATDAATQIRWGLGYIAGSYGSPCAAWSHSQSVNWY